jgi:hypothetical protein
VVTEGTNGTVIAAFTVSLSNPSYLPIGVTYATTDDTALAGSDYRSTNGTLIISSGNASTNINVTITADVPAEPDETFAVGLSAPSNATFGDSKGICTITELRFLRVSQSAGNVALTFTTGTGQNYTVESTTQLPPLVWSTVSGLGNVAGTGLPVTAIHSGGTSSSTNRFYRVRLIP